MATEGLMDQSVYPGEMRELQFVEAYWRTTLRAPQTIADAMLRAGVTASQDDRLLVAGAIAQQLGESCRRLVAVRDALFDRRFSIARSLLNPLPGVAEWRTFAQWAATSEPEGTLRDLGLGEDALESAQRLRSQPDLTWIEPLIEAQVAGNVLSLSTARQGKAATQLWVGPAPGESTPSGHLVVNEDDTATLADTTADMVSIARGFLGSYLRARLGAGRRDD
jgi:hypothetical protein